MPVGAVSVSVETAELLCAEDEPDNRGACWPHAEALANTAAKVTTVEGVRECRIETVPAAVSTGTKASAPDRNP